MEKHSGVESQVSSGEIFNLSDAQQAPLQHENIGVSKNSLQ